jgi:hypothetical protein
MIYGQSKYGTSNYGITNLVGISIVIDGLDYTQYVEQSSVKITSNIAVTQDTCAMDIIIPNHALPRPKGGQEIIVSNSQTREFAGTILDPQEEMYTPNTFVYHITCTDYTYYFNKTLVTNTYSGYTIGNIAIDIVNNHTTGGFTTSNITATGSSFFLTSKKFDHMYPSKCMDWLAASTGLQWWIDYYKNVNLGIGVGQNASFLPNNTLLPDSDLENYSDLIIDEDVSQIRNQIYLQGYKTPALYTIVQNFLCDGQNNTFYTTYEPQHVLTGITITLNGVTQAIALDVANGLPNSTLANNTCYIYYTNQSLRFNVTPTQGYVLSIKYTPMFEMVNMYNDPTSMALMALRDNEGGIYEYAVNDSSLTSIDESLANTRGQLELLEYAYPLISGQFFSYLQGWQTGQFFYMTSAARMDGQFQNTIFYVVKLDKIIVAHPKNGKPTLYYTVYFSGTPYAY